MTDHTLLEKKCQPCEGGMEPLKPDVSKALLEQVPGWSISEDGTTMTRRFEFKGFYKTMAFINALAWIANRENHHPEFSAGYNYCVVHFTTHAIGGLSENDFICAAHTNTLIEE